MSRIKICGLTRPEDILCINELEPEYMGLVFCNKSSRFVTKERAKVLKSMLRPTIKAVGVFLDNDIEEVKALLNEVPLDILQFHGKAMDEDFVRRIKEYTDVPVIRAFSVNTKEDMKRAEQSLADFVLLDSGNGGTGKVFDWELLKGFDREYFLAGGLNPSNVKEAVSTLKPFAVDVSSGVETNSLKDHEKIRQFIKIVRDCE